MHIIRGAKAASVFLFGILFISPAFADWRISEVFSNGDKDRQFIEIVNNGADQSLNNLSISIFDANAGTTSFDFPANADATVSATGQSGKRVLIATTALATAASVTADFTLNSSSLPLIQASLTLNGVTFDYTTSPASLPQDGFKSLNDDGAGNLSEATATPTNFAGTTGSISTNADRDGDGIDDTADNCPDDANADQADSDSNGIGDACEGGGGGDPSGGGGGDPSGGGGGAPGDSDGDGIPDSADPCPTDPTNSCGGGGGGGDPSGGGGNVDTDSDGILDSDDNCPNNPNADQVDRDSDGTGDVCETWRLQEIYSNSDATVQYIEIFMSGNTVTLVGGLFKVTPPQTNETYTMTATTPDGVPQFEKHYLIGTPTVSSTFGVTPDLILDASEFPKLATSDGILQAIGSAPTFGLGSELNYRDGAITSLIAGGDAKSLSLSATGTVSSTDVSPTNFNGDTIQTTCPTGQVLLNFQCQIVPAGSFFDTSSGQVQTCASGTFQPEAGQTSCNTATTTCDAGQTLDAAATTTADRTCKESAAGTFNSGSLLTASTCATGTFSAAGASACTNASTTCSAGQTQATAATSTADRTCTTAAAGTFNTGDSLIATACPTGTFSGAGATACTSASTTCPAGQAQSTAATSTADRTCGPTLPGTFSGADSLVATACPAGSFSGAGASACSPCAAGTLASTTGSSSCSAPADGFITTDGITATACESGTKPNAAKTACEPNNRPPVALNPTIPVEAGAQIVRVLVSQLATDPDGDELSSAGNTGFIMLTLGNASLWNTLPNMPSFSGSVKITDGQVEINAPYTLTFPQGDPSVEIRPPNSFLVPGTSATITTRTGSNGLYSFEISVLDREGTVLGSDKKDFGFASEFSDIRITVPAEDKGPLTALAKVTSIGGAQIEATQQFNVFSLLEAVNDEITLELLPDNTSRTFDIPFASILENDTGPTPKVTRVSDANGSGVVLTLEEDAIRLVLPGAFESDRALVAYRIENTESGQDDLAFITVTIERRGGPTITLKDPDVIPTFQAAGALATDFSKELATIVSAKDADGTAVAVNLTSDPKLRPGVNTVTYSATDRFGAVSTKNFDINVLPIVQIGDGLTIKEGEAVDITVSLTGLSPEGDVTVTLAAPTFSSSAVVVDFPSSVVIPDGETSATVTFQTTDKGVTFLTDTGMSVGIFSATTEEGSSVAVSEDKANVRITSGTPAPSFTFTALSVDSSEAQDQTLTDRELLEMGEVSTTFIEGDEAIILSVSDETGGGVAYSYSFRGFNQGTTTTDADVSFEQTRSASPIGIGLTDNLGGNEIKVEATVTSLSTGLSSTRTLTIEVEEKVESAAPLTSVGGNTVVNKDTAKQSCKATADTRDSDRDGVADNKECSDSNSDNVLDAFQSRPVSFLKIKRKSLTPLTLAEKNSIKADFAQWLATPTVKTSSSSASSLAVSEERPVTLTTRRGVSLSLGNIGRENLSVKVAPSSLPADDGFRKPDNLFDFEAVLREAGRNGTFVLPQNVPIPPNATYRKLINGTWREFVVDANNSVSSALAPFNSCPPPGSSEYQVGLTTGHNCVQLVIQDGGPNDADGVANATIVDPGGVAVPIPVGSPPAPVVDAVQIGLGQTTVITPLDNDTDPDGDTLTIVNVSAQFGEATTDGLVVNYTAPDGFFGTDFLVYQVSDGSTLVEQEITVDVFGNRGPVAVDDVASVMANAVLTFNPVTNDIDADNDQLQLVSATTNSGSVTINANGELEFVPSRAVVPTTVTITYVVQDASGAFDTGAVTVNVEASPRPSSGGGGAMGWFLVLLTLLALGRVYVRRVLPS